MATVTFFPVPSGGTPSTENTVLAAAQTINANLLQTAFLNSFGTNVLHDTTGTVSGTIAFDLTVNGAVVNLNSTATANRSAFVCNKNQNGLITSISAHPWYAEVNAKIGTAVDSVGRIACIALSGSTEDIVFGAFGAVDTVNLSLQIRGAGTTNVTTTTPIDTAAYHRYGIGFDGTTIGMYYDGVRIQTSTTLTNLTAQFGYVYSMVGNAATAANRQLIIDYQAVVTKVAA